MVNCNAQNAKTPLSYKKLIKLDKSLEGSITQYLYLWVGGHYLYNLDFKTTADKIFNFSEVSEEEAMLVPAKIQQIFQDNKQFFQFETTDTSLNIYYDKHLMLYITYVFTCESISENSDKRKMIQMFDNQGFSVWNEELQNSFREDIFQIYRKYKDEKYDVILFPKDSIYIYAPERPLIIPYQYDKEIGLSIHKICSTNHKLIKNPYTQDLTALAKKYCEIYDLSKIIFVALIVVHQ